MEMGIMGPIGLNFAPAAGHRPGGQWKDRAVVRRRKGTPPTSPPSTLLERQLSEASRPPQWATGARSRTISWRTGRHPRTGQGALARTAANAGNEGRWRLTCQRRRSRLEASLAKDLIVGTMPVPSRVSWLSEVQGWRAFYDAFHARLVGVCGWGLDTSLSPGTARLRLTLGCIPTPEVRAESTLAHIKPVRFQLTDNLPERHALSTQLPKRVAYAVEKSMRCLSLPEFAACESLQERVIERFEVDLRLEFMDLCLAFHRVLAAVASDSPAWAWHGVRRAAWRPPIHRSGRRRLLPTCVDCPTDRFLAGCVDAAWRVGHRPPGGVGVIPIFSLLTSEVLPERPMKIVLGGHNLLPAFVARFRVHEAMRRLPAAGACLVQDPNKHGWDDRLNRLRYVHR